MDPFAKNGQFKPTTMGLVSTRGSFVEPYPQPALGGALGLTSEDISSGIGSPSKKIRQRLRDPQNKFMARCREANFSIVPVGTSEISTSYVFDVNAAKAFVARYENSVGFSYLVFLIQCERVVLETVPKLIEENRQLRDLASKHIRPRRVTSNGVKMISKPSVHKEQDMFGQEYLVVKREKVPLSSLKPAEFREWKIKHRSKVMSGIQSAQDADLNVVQFLTETTAQNLLKP